MLADIRVRQEIASHIALPATSYIWGNPTADVNARVLSPQDNVEQSESPIGSTAMIKALEETKVEPL
jgi:hypothetical protein